MRSVALKGLIARPVRTILTTLAIVLGVAMVSGALTLTDTMRGGADGLTKAAYDGTDAVVTAKTAFTVDSSDYTAKTPDRRRLAARAGPRGAAGRRRRRRHHTTRPRSSPATASRSATARTSASGFDSRDDGRRGHDAVPARPTAAGPPAPGEVVIDAATAEKQQYAHRLDA